MAKSQDSQNNLARFADTRLVAADAAIDVALIPPAKSRLGLNNRQRLSPTVRLAGEPCQRVRQSRLLAIVVVQGTLIDAIDSIELIYSDTDAVGCFWLTYSYGF